MAEAKAQGIHGKETTPFLLAKIKDLTGGDSLASNIQLVYNNAKLAAATAVRAEQACQELNFLLHWTGREVPGQSFCRFRRNSHGREGALSAGEHTTDTIWAFLGSPWGLLGPGWLV